jgi:hypothetical protein
MSELLIITLCFMPLVLYITLNAKAKDSEESTNALFEKYIPATKSIKQDISSNN